MLDIISAIGWFRWCKIRVMTVLMLMMVEKWCEVEDSQGCLLGVSPAIEMSKSVRCIVYSIMQLHHAYVLCRDALAALQLELSRKWLLFSRLSFNSFN